MRINTGNCGLFVCIMSTNMLRVVFARIKQTAAFYSIERQLNEGEILRYHMNNTYAHLDKGAESKRDF